MSAFLRGRYNNNGGYYVPGRSYSIETKVRVRDTYLRSYLENPNCEPTTTTIAVKTGVGKTYAWYMIKETKSKGDIVDPEDNIRKAS